MVILALMNEQDHCSEKLHIVASAPRRKTGQDYHWPIIQPVLHSIYTRICTWQAVNPSQTISSFFLESFLSSAEPVSRNTSLFIRRKKYGFIRSLNAYKEYSNTKQENTYYNKFSTTDSDFSTMKCSKLRWIDLNGLSSSHGLN